MEGVQDAEGEDQEGVRVPGLLNAAAVLEGCGLHEARPNLLHVESTESEFQRPEALVCAKNH